MLPVQKRTFVDQLPLWIATLGLLGLALIIWVDPTVLIVALGLGGK